jgi:hypothetical protein
MGPLEEAFYIFPLYFGEKLRHADLRSQEIL